MGGTKKLLEMLYLPKIDKAQATGIKLLRVLSVEDQNKVEIIENNGVDVLIANMTGTTKPIEMDAMWTLRNISDQINNHTNVQTEPVLRLCIDKLSSHDINHVISAAGILSNLTCNDYINKTKFVELGGVIQMTRVVQRASDKDGFRDDVVEPGITTLRHVTRDRGDDQGEMGTWAENARRKCQTLIPTAIQLLGPAKASWPTVKATIGFLRNIAHDKKVHFKNTACLRDFLTTKIDAF